MQNLFSMFVIGGVVAATALPAWACGGGGAGCAMSRGGYGYGGGRAVAYGKVAGRAPMLAQAAPQRGCPQAGSPAAAVAGRPASATLRTVAVTTKATVKSGAPTSVYTCPMHPQVQWTKPTDCPICGMKLKLKQTKADAIKRAPTTSDEHAGMDMDEMGDMPGMDQDGMGGMKMCPGCMMNMGGMSKMNGGKAAPAASQKASGGAMRMAGMGCGC